MIFLKTAFASVGTIRATCHVEVYVVYVTIPILHQHLIDSAYETSSLLGSLLHFVLGPHHGANGNRSP